MHAVAARNLASKRKRWALGMARYRPAYVTSHQPRPPIIGDPHPASVTKNTLIW